MQWIAHRRSPRPESRLTRCNLALFRLLSWRSRVEQGTNLKACSPQRIVHVPAPKMTIATCDRSEHGADRRSVVGMQLWQRSHSARDNGRQGNGQSKRMSRQASRRVKHPMAWYMLRFWYGMRFTTWMRELARNRFAISPSHVPMACAITGFTIANSALAALEQVIYGRRIDAAQPRESPVFVLGHWRAGTTFLHELMIRDPHHTYATTYECFAPHHFVLTERYLTPWLGSLIPAQRPMDNMPLGWDRPQEDEFALANLGAPTPYLSIMFPNRGEQYPSYLTLHNLSPGDREAWKRELMQFIRRLSYLDDTRRIVIKSPGHTARVRTLLEMFPDARFVHIARDPHKLFPSTIKLWQALNTEMGLQAVRDDDTWLEQSVIESFRVMYDAYLQDRKALRDDQLVEVRYEDLVENPKAQLRAIYERLQLGEFARVEPALDAYLADVGDYRTNSYAEDDAVRERIRREWATYFEEFGYE